MAQRESLSFKRIGGLAVRRACYGVAHFILESGAKGCEVIISECCARSAPRLRSSRTGT